ncbi:NAD(P)H-binding protein [Pseudenhygromyxa sp. WMMC2535]|uniref:NAD(P)H-binding protein n=1 Tax=Pseudenhygromyxa sp. WMMC2535 TaxID=2712867 RepID=UPI001553623E|nr:NAD(P)H-binding protein [Pseudenhygromyxa sp. WMMC2535]NVB42966.1 NAD(P)H-binding protein [Pseudenhygromyxa sp. WMMC2535]
MTKPLAVIAGATGYLGGHVALAARRSGYRVRALARDASRVPSDACDEIFEAQATEPATLEGLFEGASVAFSSVGVRHFRRHPDIWEVDERANLNLVEAAERAGVERFVFVSLFDGEHIREGLAVAEARERVVDRLRRSPMTRAVLRPTGFFNDMDEILEMARGGRVWLIGSGEQRLNPIHGADLAAEAVAHFAGEQGEWDVGGPEVLSQREIGALAFAALERPARFGHLPPGVIEAAAALAGPFSVNARTFLRMFAMLGRRDIVAPCAGTRRLAEHFRARVQASARAA